MNQLANQICLLTTVVLATIQTSCAPIGELNESHDRSASEVTRNDVSGGSSKWVTNHSDPVLSQVESAMELIEQREVLITNGFWTVTHGILGVGPRLTLYDPETEQRVNALDCIRHGGPLRGLRFIPTEYGVDVPNGPMYIGQGHVDQFVAELVQVGVSPDTEFVIQGTRYTLLDFIHEAQSRVRPTGDQELSWTIVAIGQCLGTNGSWTNRFGETVRFEDLVRNELDQEVEHAACGGVHRLFGLAWVHQLHLSSGGEDVGVWQEIPEKMSAYERRARAWQNPDGSFSTLSFRGVGNDPDLQVRISTTGHVFEWLALCLTDEELRQSWVSNAAGALSEMIITSREVSIDAGALYHALHGLRMYAARQPK